MTGAVGKSFLVIEALVAAHGPVRLSTLADQLGLQKSTTHRVLNDLIELGYVEQNDESGLYRPTLRMWELGQTVVADLPIKQVAANSLFQLHATTRETVSLIIRSGDDALYLDKIISPRPVRFTTRVGSRVPLPIPAGGKAILAFSADGDDVVRRLGDRRDPQYPIEVDKVLRSLDRTRSSGYAISSARPGTRSIAAAVLDRDHNPVGALSVSAPTDRLDRSAQDTVVAELVATATHLSESLGRL